MKTFLSVKIALLPFVLFWMLSGMGYSLPGALAGAVLAALALAYRVRTRGPMLLEGGALLVLALIALLHISPFASYASHGAAWSFLALGAACGGLTAAALLAQSGLRVIVLEQHVVPGGFAHTWLRKGKDGDARPVFRFDSGVHDISGWWDGAPVHGVFRRLGLAQRVQWR